MHWEGTILVINYKKYGKYIQNHYYDFNDTQLHAIFELDMMLHLIHKEMQKLIGVVQPTPSVTIDHNPDEEPFKFIHPMISGDEMWDIHEEVKRLVKHQKIPEICAYLKELKQKGKVLLPSNPIVMYEELVRLGMSTGKGFTEKHFRNYYVK